MASRLSLHSDLLTITNKVYYQPPESVKMTFPCIVYELADKEMVSADDSIYLKTNSYTITAISKDPDNSLADSIIAKFPMSRFDRRFVSENLYHDVITIYY